MKHKALAYITRVNQGVKELLVFDHVKYPHVSPQVIKGSVDENETYIEAVVREVLEESGLSLACSPIHSGSFEYKELESNQDWLIHVFVFETEENLLDTWEHIVSDGEEDKGLLFKFYWLPINEAKEKLVSNLGDYL